MEAGISPRPHSEMRMKVRFGDDCLAMNVPSLINFEQLASRIDARLSPHTSLSLQARTLKLSYCDSDGDMVWIDGDEALGEALWSQQLLESNELHSVCPPVYFRVQIVTRTSSSRSIAQDVVVAATAVDKVYGGAVQQQDVCNGDLPSITDEILTDIMSDTVHVGMDSRLFYTYSEPCPDGLSELAGQPSDTAKNNQRNPDVDWDQWVTKSSSASDERGRRKRRKLTHTRLTKEQKNVLQDWYDTHHGYPYPTASDLDALKIQTKLEPTRIKNWFSRTRQKDPLPLELFHSKTRNKIALERGFHVDLEIDKAETMEFELDRLESAPPVSRPEWQPETSPASRASSQSSGPVSMAARSSLDVAVASPAAHSPERDILEEGPLCSEPESLGGDSIVSNWNTGDGGLTGREHDKLSWWLEQLTTTNPDTSLDNRADRELECYEWALTPHQIDWPYDSAHYRYDAYARSETGGANHNIDEFDMEELALFSKNVIHQSPNLASSEVVGQRKLSLREHNQAIKQARSQMRRETPAKAQSEASFGAESAQSRLSANSSASHHSECSYTSFGPRRGRKRPAISLLEQQASILSARRQASGYPSPPPRLCGSDAVVESSSTTKARASTQPSSRFKCELCGLEYSTKYCLMRHIKAIHNPKIIWICDPLHNPSGDRSLCFICNIDKIYCHHEIGPCWTETEEKRTYYRKDNFKAHLKAIHKVTIEELKALNISKYEHQFAGAPS